MFNYVVGIMDQDKIGKLIAKLRKEKGLTQRELGEKVGVGFKAVSKWERGITCPDISIINELSKILGITSDELLTGKLNPEHTSNGKILKHSSKKILLIVAIICFIGAIFFIIHKINNDMVEVYNLDSASAKYYVEGKAIFKNKQIAIRISECKIYDTEFNEIIIKNYKYNIDCDDNTLVIYGYLLDDSEIFGLVSVKDIMDNFTINFENELPISKKDVLYKGLVLKLTFVDKDDNFIQKDIVLTLNKSK